VSPTRSIILVWLGWLVLLCGYQVFAPARLTLQRPDYATAWTPQETRADSHIGHPYLQGPFLNGHVAWDSEYYLSIALHGYDDPQMQAVARDADPGDPRPGLKGDHPDWVSLNDAFFPAYPIAMRIVSWPLRVLGLDPIAAATLAGVAVSAVGTLFAMLALADLAGGEDEEDERLRAAFYYVILPAGVFLAGVYTEGMFAGLSFGAIALLRRRKLAWAALLAVVATWTRATGALLVIPLLWSWVEGGGPLRLAARPWGRELAALGLVATPLLAYLAWRAALGRDFAAVEEHYFGRAAFALAASLESWRDAASAFWNGPAEAKAYYLVEFVGAAFGIAVSILIWRRERMLALYGLAVVAVALTSGVALGMHRYILGVPAVALVPARWGRSPVADRIWTLGNILVMAVFALAFSADFWAG
jgi:hypothetical protein